MFFSDYAMHKHKPYARHLPYMKGSKFFFFNFRIFKVLKTLVCVYNILISKGYTCLTHVENPHLHIDM